MRATVIVYGDHVDTDVIIPARYLSTSKPEELAVHCMEDLDRTFHGRVKDGARIVVAGKNFGCGSSREHAPIALKAAGVQCVVADSFARIFYRNAINIGLPIVECPQAAADILDGNEISVDLEKGEITNHTSGMVYKTQPFPPFMQSIITAGGLVPLIKSRKGEA